MQPLTFSTNKHFIPIANKPLIFYPIETIADAKIKEVLITYNPGWLEPVQKYLGTGSKWNLKFTYVMQEKPLGLANIFQVCEKYIKGDDFVLHLGDNIFADGIGDLMSYFVKNKPNGLVAKVRHPENTRMGVPYFDKKGRLVKYVEKPKNPPHNFAIPGIYFFDKNVFKCFGGKDKIKLSKRGEYEIGASYQWLIDHKFKVDVVEYKGKWLDPGKFDDWIYANQYLLDSRNNLDVKSKTNNCKIIGKVCIGKSCRISNSEIQGSSSIGDHVKISDSFVGPYASISDNCVIEKSRVENSVLMNGVVIKNVDRPISESVIGSEAEIIEGKSAKKCFKMFIGEKSIIKV